MRARVEEPAPDPVGRLTTLGLPPRPAGWVPEQPAGLGGPELPEPGSAHAAATALPSRLDLARLAAAERLPASVGDRVRGMSSSGFVSSVLVIVAIAVAVGIVLHDRHRNTYDSYSTPISDASAPAVPAGDISDGSSIVVDVGGDVRHPGLVTLPVGARVADAITAAGGPLHPRELAATNLAARVTDGELLLIGRKAGHGDAAAGSSGLISLSSASLTKLETLPGVGPVTAQKIIDWRNAHGGFTSVEQLQQVSGIGPTRYAELSPLVAP